MSLCILEAEVVLGVLHHKLGGGDFGFLLGVSDEQQTHCIFENTIGKRKTINIKNFGGTLPLLDRNHPGACPVCPVEMSCVCPADILSNLCGSAHTSGRDIPGVPGTAPQTVPRRLQRDADHQIPLCLFCYQGFLILNLRPQKFCNTKFIFGRHWFGKRFKNGSESSEYVSFAEKELQKQYGKL